MEDARLVGRGKTPCNLRHPAWELHDDVARRELALLPQGTTTLKLGFITDRFVRYLRYSWLELLFASSGSQHLRC